MESQMIKKISEELLNSNNRSYVLELATGVGKTKLALDKINQLYNPFCMILIVIPRNVLIKNWIKEFKKWGYMDMLPNVTFVTYVSLPKMKGMWDICVFDECHHLSERCREALNDFHIEYSLFLSATISKEIRQYINYEFKNAKWIKVNTRKAIDNNVLPDPKIVLIPLTLDTSKANYLYVSKKPKGNLKPLVVPYKDRWNYKTYKGGLILECTQQQYYNELSSLIEWYKRKNYIPAMKNLWLHKAGERLKWLSEQKMETVLKITAAIPSRKIIFCGTIQQSDNLGFPCVNSKIGTDNLEAFNKGKVNAISCINMLDEGANLNDCPCGIFMSLNSSERMQIQKVGRLLRHSNPIIYIPFFKNTREEKIVSKMLEGYNKELIVVRHIH